MNQVISMIESRQANLENNIDVIEDELLDIEVKKEELKKLLETRKQEVKDCRDAIIVLKEMS